VFKSNDYDVTFMVLERNGCYNRVAVMVLESLCIASHLSNSYGVGVNGYGVGVNGYGVGE
jgi:hypothetical protein